MTTDTHIAALRLAADTLDDIRGNINPERGFADELENDVVKARDALLARIALVEIDAHKDKVQADKHDELMQVGKSAYDAIDEMVTNLNAAHDDNDEPRIRICEDALSVEVRSDWYSPGGDGESSEPVEFKILLSTGGPASRIVGELRDGEPVSAKLEVQDWFTAWTEYRGDEVSESVLLDYCRCFYFGEG